MDSHSLDNQRGSPGGVRHPGKLRLFNSFTKKKEEFVPVGGKKVAWYSCGPTVYDAAHMGHARTYISFDIIRRILTGYFNYDVFFVMNITDIDDKIIKRARQEYLLKQYSEKYSNPSKEDLIDALEYFRGRVNVETDVDKKCMLTKILETTEQRLSTGSITTDECRDVLMDWLDHKLGSTVQDNSVFSCLPRKFEDAFYQDMEALNVAPADVITRVSEYVPEIVDYIQKICDNGYAYASNGSVYFNTGVFDSDPKHRYAKLVPEAVGDKKAMSEGEGILSEDKAGEKKHSNDFALWKASKAGEPSWPSQWGSGRPGWHIECSVMASALLGQSLDIHSGGYDLKFPHHDNEIAQAEAYFDTGNNWVKYFLHSGHLTISGCKMSKSLKNFITIKDALSRHSARQLRFAFLMHTWKDTLDYSENSMHDAIGYEKFCAEFFLAVQDVVRSGNSREFEKWSDLEVKLNQTYHETVAAVDEALCDNIDTRRSLDVIKELISACNIYLKSTATPNAVLLKTIGLYVTRMFKIYGLIEEDATELGFPRKRDSSEQNVNREEIIMPLLDVLCGFREEMRAIAKEHKLTSILEKCDNLRDNILPELGIKIEDKEVCGVTKTVKKLVDKEILRREREEKARLEEEKRLAKEQRIKEQLEAKAAREAKNKIDPKDMFKDDPNYSAFDENGFPTLDRNGEPLKKSQIKNLTKLRNAQERKFQEYQKSLKSTES